MARDYNRNNRQNENENYNDVTNRIIFTCVYLD